MYVHYEDVGLWFSCFVTPFPGFDMKVMPTSLNGLGRWEGLFLLCFLKGFVQYWRFLP